MSRPAVVFVAALFVVGAAGGASAVETRPRAVYWQPYDGGAVAAAARRALERNLAARGIALVDGSDAPPASPPLLPALDAAREDYRAFRFADAVTRLDALAAQVQAAGGGELDARQLSDLYLFRGLARSELGQADAAWDDFARAAQLEPERLLDPARVSPRALAAFRRAAAEALALAPATIELLPAGLRLRVDGRDLTPPLTLAPGRHLVRAGAAGLLPWAGTIEVTASRQHIELPLVPQRPNAAQLDALAGSDHALRAVVVREEGGWRLHLRDGVRGFDAAIDADSAERVVDLGLQRLDAAPVARAAPPRKRRTLPWWGWTLIGGAAAAAIIVPVAVVFAPGSGGGTVGGTIGALR